MACAQRGAGVAFVDDWVANQDKALERFQDWSTLPYATLAQDVTWELARTHPWKALAMEKVAPIPWYQWRRFFSRLESPKKLLGPSPITVVLWNAVMAPGLRSQDRAEVLASKMLLSRLLRVGLGMSEGDDEEDGWTKLSALSAMRFSVTGQRIESTADAPCRHDPAEMTPPGDQTESRLRVEAIVSGRLAPSSRYRVLQHVPTLRDLGIDVSAKPPRISKYASVPDRVLRRRFAGPAMRAALKPAKVAVRVPALAATWKSDVSWLEREMLPGHLTLEPLLKRPMLFDVDDSIWLLSPGHGRAVDAIARARHMCHRWERFSGRVVLVSRPRGGMRLDRRGHRPLDARRRALGPFYDRMDRHGIEPQVPPGHLSHIESIHGGCTRCPVGGVGRSNG